MSTWKTYRPWLERTLFGLSMLGMLIVVHLALQEQRGFDRGCLGLTDGAAATTFDCAAVVGSDAGALFGVSNVVWGFLFYAAIAVITFLVVRASAAQRPVVAKLRAGLLGTGVLYTGYLMYVQFVQLDAFCALCLASATVVVTMAAAVALPLLSSTSSSKPMSDTTRRSEYKFLGILVAAAVVLMGADVAYFTQTAPQSHLPAEFTSASVDVPEECRFDAEKQPLQNWESLVRDDDPIKGTPDAPVTIIEFFDPNCPHCATMHEVLEVVKEQNSDRARFVSKPFPLWEYSVPQIEALYAAAEVDKFHEMLDMQYDNQRSGGLSETQLRAIAERIDMDPDLVSAHIEDDRHVRRIMHQRQQGIAAGVSSTPTVLINGHFVAPQSRSPECFDAFISAAHDANS
ncbi:MAG: vitamin K epoxide reductase family protein [Longimonas sp.]|uniref:vitamin K epoxide reductase family protein n=1 Tax=Longimonas sp. TaxID=2039626 RepID=UPI003360F90F